MPLPYESHAGAELNSRIYHDTRTQLKGAWRSEAQIKLISGERQLTRV